MAHGMDYDDYYALYYYQDNTKLENTLPPDSNPMDAFITIDSRNNP